MGVVQQSCNSPPPSAKLQVLRASGSSIKNAVPFCDPVLESWLCGGNCVIRPAGPRTFNSSGPFGFQNGTAFLGFQNGVLFLLRAPRLALWSQAHARCLRPCCNPAAPLTLGRIEVINRTPGSAVQSEACERFPLRSAAGSLLLPMWTSAGSG